MARSKHYNSRFYLSIYLTCLCISLILPITNAFAQQNKKDYIQYYAFGEDPQLKLTNSLYRKESILFEATPVVRFSIYNDFVYGLKNLKEHTSAWLLSLEPQLRVYEDSNLPVRTPNLKFSLETQHLFRLANDPNPGGGSEKFLGILFKSGHLSNGQSDCLFLKHAARNSPECQGIHSSLKQYDNLADLLNRETGNFATNLTELVVNYQSYKLGMYNIPYELKSFSLGYQYNHFNIWGLSRMGAVSEYLFDIFGRHKVFFTFDHSYVFKKGMGRRLTLRHTLNFIPDAHLQINPIRLENSAIFYPFVHPKALGILLGYAYGHDNYNSRIIDAGHQISLGVSYKLFAPISLK